MHFLRSIPPLFSRVLGSETYVPLSVIILAMLLVTHFASAAPASTQGINATQTGYLKAINAEAGDRFGFVLDIDGNTMVVGALNEDSNGSSPADNSVTDSGAVYVFVRQNGTWVQQAYLKASNAETNDRFGRAVAISGDTLVVGAAGEDGNGSSPTDNSVTDSGAAYVFVRQNGAWTQQAYLKASNAETNDYFGISVGISGETVVVGAFAEDSNGSSPNDNSTSAAGAAYVFLRQNNAWAQQAYLKASNPDADDWFGLNIAISGDTIVVGADGEDSNGSDPNNNSLPDSGAAYVFLRQNGIWAQQAYLKAANPNINDQFGRAIAISIDTIVVGAQNEDGNGTNPSDNSATDSGAAYVFVRENDEWTQQTYLKAANLQTGDWFGFAVDISNDTIVVGAMNENGNGSDPNDNSTALAGAAYLFVRQDGAWVQQAYLKASNVESNDLFGIAVGISGNTIVVGADGEDGNGSDPSDNSASTAGAAYTFGFVPPLDNHLYLPFVAK